MSSQPRLWITRKLSDNTLARTAQSYELVLNETDRLYTSEEIVEIGQTVDAILPCHSEHFSADIAARLGPRVKIIANHSVGVDHCDIPALNAHGIAVTNTPDVLSDATAELAMLLMLGAPLL